MTPVSRRLPGEWRIAVALTLAMIVALFLLAGMARFTEDPGEMLVLAFDRALGVSAPPAAPAPVAAPGPSASAPSRMAIDPVMLAARGPSATPRTERAERSALSSRALDTTDPALPSEPRPVATSRRSLIPRTRVSTRPSGRVILDAAAPLATAAASSPPKAAAVPALKARQAPERTVPDTAPVDLFEDDRLDPSAIFDWMRGRPGELPPAIKRHVDYTAEALTAVDTLTHDAYPDDIHELYLMGRPATRELHIVLVRGSLSYYFIDRGGARRGHKFRAGMVRRDEGTITGIVSEDQPLDSPDAQFLFQVFLSWWDSLDDARTQ